MKRIITIVLLSLATAGISGCSKDEDPSDPDTKRAKITLSVSGTFSKADGDDFTFHVGGATTAGTSIDWKIQGKVEKGTVISLTSDDVDGGKSGISVESVQDFMVGQTAISCFNISGEPFTVTYKIEVNGKIIDEQTVESAAGDDPFTKSYKL